MRLHRLSMTAFGPFAGTAEIDFEQLSTDGLFLLHGATGAGKTTVLDAIAFALYGRVPGVRGRENRLRCDYAPADVAPRVELEASIGGRRLRIVRSPEFHRPKQRGDGHRKINAQVSLTWLDGVGNNLTRHTDVGDEVNRLLGMSADQFFQVVMLPQGEFAKFLVAANDEREKLLERLFDTGRFKTAEDWLADQRRQSADELATLSQARDRLASEIKGVTAAELPTDDHTDWATDLLEAARTRLADGEVAYSRSKAALNLAQDRMAEETALDARLARRTRAAAEIEALEAQRGRVSDAETELLWARQAVRVSVLDARLTESKALLVTAQRRVESKAVPLAADTDGNELVASLRGCDADEHADLVASAIARWTTEIGQLAAIIPEAERLAAIEAHTEQLATEHARMCRRLDHLNEQRIAIPAQLAAAEADLATVHTVAARIESLASLQEALARQLDAARRLVEQDRLVAAAAEAEKQRRETHLAAREQLVEVRERRLNSMAAELAAALAQDEPCQVCGSTTHPAPAQPSGTGANKADEAKARDLEEVAAEARERAHQQLVALQREADRLAVVSERESAVVVAAKLAETDADLRAARAAAERAHALSGEIERLRTRVAALDAEIRESEKAVTKLAEQLAAGETESARLQAAIGGVCGGDATPVERRDRLAQLVRHASALREAIVAASAARTDIADLEMKIEETARDSGFDSGPAARLAARTDAQMGVLEATLRDFEDRHLRAMAILEETAADHGKASKVESAAAELTDATTAAERAAAELAAAKAEVAKLERLVVDLWAADSKIAPKRERHEELAGVADLVAGRGQNQRKISLRSYVLAARLEEVAAEASLRLRRMSGGRFEFVHSDAAGPRGTLGGLGLDVRDLYNDQVRSVKTLSGGEKFMASLACALGLADVVANESGGTMLDTLFIDEGFGALDGESLESVMSVIDDLREGGRIIGVVSHVEEMRQRIPSRLHVVRGNSGSRLEMQVS